MANYIKHIEAGVTWYECYCKKQMIIDESHILVLGTKYLVSKGSWKNFVNIRGNFTKFAFTQHPIKIKATLQVLATNLAKYLDYCFQ